MSDGERIGSTEREAAVADLRTHAAAGRLSSTEYEARSQKVAEAGTWGQLSALFSDLPEPRPRPGGQAPPPPPYGTAPPPPPYGTAPPAPPYGDAPSTGPHGTVPSSPPPPPYGANQTPPGWGGGPFGNGGPPPALRRIWPLLPIIIVVLAITTHVWVLFFLFPAMGALWGNNGRNRGGGGRRRGRRYF